MDPLDNITLAKVLESIPKGAPPEASLRCACGRAYYSALALSRDALLDHFSIPRDASGHGTVIQLLKKSSNPDVKAAGGVLDQLRITRNSADYEVGKIKLRGKAFVPYRVQVAVASASVVISAVRKARKADPKMGIDQ